MTWNTLVLGRLTGSAAPAVVSESGIISGADLLGLAVGVSVIPQLDFVRSDGTLSRVR